MEIRDKISLLVAVLAMMILALPVAATDYYIDGVNGDDANDGLSPATAWKTLDKGSEPAGGVFVGGDVVHVAAGTYLTPDVNGYTFGRSGADGSPITYKAEGRVVVDGGLTANQAIMLGASGVAARYLTFDGFEVKGSTRFGIAAGRFSGAFADGFTLKNSIVHDIGNSGSPYAYATFIDWSNGNTYTNNVFYNIQQDRESSSIWVRGYGSGTETTRIYNNTFYRGGMNVVGISSGEVVEFKNNIVVDMVFQLANWSGDPANIIDDYNLWLNYPDPPIYNGYDGPHDILGQDPLFVSIESGNFRVQAESPAIDAGVDVGLPYNGPAPDIGCFETDYTTAVGWLRGRVFDGLTGQAIEGAQVTETVTHETTYSDVNGGYMLVLAPGSHVISVSKAGYGTQQATVLITAGFWFDQDFDLARPAVTIDRLSNLKTITPLPARVYVRLRKIAMSNSGSLPADYYIEEPGRSCGIRVVPQEGITEVQEGDEVTLSGTLNRDENGELCIFADVINGVWPGTKLRPLGMSNKSLFRPDGEALGLLVKIWGKVTHRSSDGSYCYVDDGSGVDDGTGIATGVRVIPRNFSSPEVDSFVAVTGFAGLAKVGSVTLPAVRVLNTHKLIASAPMVMCDNVVWPWGGHTFGYVIEGSQAIYWSGRVYQPGLIIDVMDSVVGQYPKPGSSLPIAQTSIELNTPNVIGNGIPHLIRTPDGYIHVFLAVVTKDPVTQQTNTRLRYYRSSVADDISTLIDRTELIPTTPFSDFHARMNYGISPDGNKLVIVILTTNTQGVGFNTPVIFRAQRSGLDFAFQNPVVYAEPMALFYPQVCLQNDGQVIIVGEIWDESNVKLYSRLLNLDASNTIVHREDFPSDVGENHWSFDMRPWNGTDWSKLLLYVSYVPADQNLPANHEFWKYDVAARQLAMIRSVAVHRSLANWGEIVQLPPYGGQIFLNNPSSGAMYYWDGDLLGNAGVSYNLLCNQYAYGYRGSSYVSVPNQLYGSVPPRAEEFYVMMDVANPERQPDQPGPQSYLLWHIRSIGNIQVLR